MTTTQYPNSSPNEPYAIEDIGIDNIRSSKFNLIIVTAVLALHGLVSWSLANIDIVTRPINPITPKPPLEVEMVILPDVDAPVELKEVEDPPLKPIDKPVAPPKAEIKPKPDPKPKSVNKPLQKPIEQPKPQPVKQTPPPVSKAPEKPVEHKPIKDKVVEKVVEAPAKPPTPFPNTLTVNESQTVIQQQQDTERLAQQKLAQEQAARDKLAQEKAAADAKAEQARLARESAEREAKAQAALKAQQAAANNKPQDFSASDAGWISRPSPNFPPRAKRTSKPGDVFKVTVRLRVDKQGNIVNAFVVSPSGNTIIDNAAVNDAKKGKLHPFKKGGVPVVGNVNVPLEYRMP